MTRRTYVLTGRSLGAASATNAGWLGTAAGAAAGPVGAAIGGAISNFLTNAFGGGPSAWDDAGPGVHEWFTVHGEQAFLDWMRDKHPDGFGSVDTVVGLNALWLAEQRKLIRPGEFQMVQNGPAVMAAYQAMGVDYQATNAANQVPNAPINFVFLPNVDPQMPPGAAAGLNNLANKIDAGEPLTPGETILANDVADADDAASQGGGSGLLLAFAAAVLLLK